MAEKFLDSSNIVAAFKQVRGKCLPAAGPFLGKRIVRLDVLVGQDRSAGCDSAEQGREGGTRG